MRTSFHDLERRISRLERQIQPPTPCNCRLVTHFHNAHCLAAILEKTERKCPVHGFREMGFLFQRSCPYPVVDEDNQFCRCPPHPWRSLQLRRDSVTKEDCAAAMQAWHDNPPGPESNFEFQENSDRTKSLFKSYFEERHQWPRETGRQLPSLEERRILHAKQYRRSGNR